MTLRLLLTRATPASSSPSGRVRLTTWRRRRGLGFAARLAVRLLPRIPAARVEAGYRFTPNVYAGWCSTMRLASRTTAQAGRAARATTWDSDSTALPTPCPANPWIPWFRHRGRLRMAEPCPDAGRLLRRRGGRTASVRACGLGADSHLAEPAARLFLQFKLVSTGPWTALSGGLSFNEIPNKGAARVPDVGFRISFLLYSHLSSCTKRSNTVARCAGECRSRVRNLQHEAFRSSAPLIRSRRHLIVVDWIGVQ